ncbi:hypothetical protein ACHIPZ_14705 [Antrihabitans sp. NCIMB 15449]|uniref:Uncharacterized protein n=1 Tax=Antrihabitans spumae TaxID=3373370 RepID=A0ABW7JP62_9NOCA
MSSVNTRWERTDYAAGYATRSRTAQRVPALRNTRDLLQGVRSANAMCAVRAKGSTRAGLTTAGA